MTALLPHVSAWAGDVLARPCRDEVPTAPSVVRNSVANLGAGAVLALATLVWTPYIVSRLGTRGYGLLAIITSIVGCFGIIDINVAAGAVKFVAEYRARKDARAESGAILVAFLLATIIGLVGCAGIAFAARPLLARFFEASAADRDLAVIAMRIAAVGFLVAQLEQVAASLPQALQRFQVKAGLEAAVGLAIPALTVLTLYLGGGLVEVVVVRVVCSAMSLAVLLWVCRRMFPEFRWHWPPFSQVRRILSFSGFAYLSRVASVSFHHTDKLVIGSFFGLEAVAFYAVAATVASRVMTLTHRISSVVYPAASALGATGQWGPLRATYLSAARYVYSINVAAVILIAFFSREILHHWLGPAFASHGAAILVVMAVSMLVDSMTTLPAVVNDGLGHTRVTGTFAALRAAVGALAIVMLANQAGIVGVALGHLSSGALLAALFLVYVHGRGVPFKLSDYLREGYLRPTLVFGGLAAVSWLLRPSAVLPLGETFVVAGILALATALAGLFAIKAEHRSWVRQRMSRSLALFVPAR